MPSTLNEASADSIISKRNFSLDLFVFLTTS